jgi:hypothetical protein
MSMKYKSLTLFKQVEKAEKEKIAGNVKFKEGKYGRLELKIGFIFVKFGCSSSHLELAAAEAKVLYEAGLKYTKSLFKVQVQHGLDRA